MTRRRLAATLFIALALILATTSLALGRPVRSPDALESAAFTPIELGPPATGAAPVASAAADDFGPIADFQRPDRSFAARPQPAHDVAPRVVPVATPTPRPPAPAPAAAGSTTRVSGSASWYCLAGVSVCHKDYASGMYAAAGPALRVGDWRGRVVTVCSGGTCVNVRLVDWCQCYGSRVIDLYSDAFRRLAPLSQGTVSVTVHW